MQVLPYYTAKTTHRDKNLFTSTITDSAGNNKRYFSSLDAEIYFGDILIDEIIEIAYDVSENVMPIYGYNSQTFDTLVTGTRLIQGQFTINFTKSGWVVECINKLKTILGTSNEQIESCCKRTNSCGDSSKPKLGGMFDIIVSFGDHRSKIKSTGSSAHLIKGVKVIRYSQNFNTSGEPISETYMFIANDIDFNAESDGKGLDNSFSSGTNSVKKDNAKKRSNLNIAYSKDNAQITKAQELADKNNDLSLSVLCEHEYIDGKGSICTTFKILNKNIDKSYLKINAISIVPTDKRPNYIGMPNFKSNKFRNSLDSNKDIVSVIEMADGLEQYNSKIYKQFRKERNNAYIDAVITAEVEYKGTKITVSNKPIKITPGTSYNF